MHTIIECRGTAVSLGQEGGLPAQLAGLRKHLHVSASCTARTPFLRPDSYFFLCQCMRTIMYIISA